MDEARRRHTHLLQMALRDRAAVKACGTCTMERGVEEREMLPVVQVASIRELVGWVAESDQVLSL
ncbi:MAG: DsrE family protein [Chloroflexi bacterium]|nr:DsrE family protein [Chloroflexota bacterium]